VANPAGIRLGVQEMTRLGMKEQEMSLIAELFRKCLREGKYVGEEVRELRRGFRQVRFSFDEPDKE